MRWLLLALTVLSCRGSELVVCVSDDGCGRAASHDCIAPSIAVEFRTLPQGQELDECRRRGFLHCGGTWCTRPARK